MKQQNDITRLKQAIVDVIDERIGLEEGKVDSARNSTIRYLLGMYADHMDNLDLSVDEVVGYLEAVRTHKFNTTAQEAFSGTENNFSDVIEFSDHPLYQATEYELMTFKPGSLQLGPGEFFMYFYHADSELGVDSVSGWDVRIKLDGKWIRVELKKINSNFAFKMKDGEYLFDHYTDMANDDKLDVLLVTMPISNAKNPRLRSRFVAINLRDTKWREVFTYGTPNKNELTATLRIK